MTTDRGHCITEALKSRSGVGGEDRTARKGQRWAKIEDGNNWRPESEGKHEKRRNVIKETDERNTGASFCYQLFLSTFCFSYFNLITFSRQPLSFYTPTPHHESRPFAFCQGRHYHLWPAGELWFSASELMLCQCFEFMLLPLASVWRQHQTPQADRAGRSCQMWVGTLSFTQ